MRIYDKKIIQSVQKLRSEGKTYKEINNTLNLTIPKSSLSYLCKSIDPGEDYRTRIKLDMEKNLPIIRKLAVKKNKELFENKLAQMRSDSQYVSKIIHDPKVAKIALAMLYLGEGAKWKGRRCPMLGSSDPKIIRIYLNLLERCYNIESENIRCRIQHRADQNKDELLEFWAGVTELPKNQFYPSYVDKRTIGKATKKTEYRGVCVVTSRGTHIQLELAIIADIIDEVLGS